MVHKHTHGLGRPRTDSLWKVCRGDARRDCGRGTIFAIIIVFAAALAPISGSYADAEQGESSSGPVSPLPTLVVTQLPADAAQRQQATGVPGTLRASYGDGARLVLWSPAAASRVATQGFHSAADPCVSFDGKRILFAGKRTAADRWAIYEMTITSGQSRQITHQRGDCRTPCYHGPMYTITENDPWHQITFVEGEPGVLNECGVAQATGLYSCKLDGTFVQRLTYNLSSDYDPAVMPDGRIVFAAWQRAELDRGPAGRIALLGVNIDGIDPAPFCVHQGRRVKHMPCVTTGGLTVFVEGDTVPWDGAGMLSCVSLRRPLHSYRTITGPSDGLFHSPSPLPDGRILVARRPSNGTGTHAVCWMDLASRRIEPVLHDPRFHSIQAKAIVPTGEPDGRSSVLTPEVPLGKFYCLDVSKNDFKDAAWLARGTAKKVRVIEGIPRTKPAGQGAAPALAQRRILGEAPLAADGSFNVEVPANLPIQLQLLDDKGIALRSCGWIWTRNHEPQGCIGCHEDPELTPTNRVVDAVAVNSVSLCPPPERRSSVDFRRDVMPILAGKCVDCHSAGGSPPRLDGRADGASDQTADGSAKNVYETLLAQDRSGPRGEPAWKYVHPGRSRTSPLVWHLFGVNTSRPWDGLAATQPAKPIAADKAKPLSGQERDVLVRWIDLGAAWESASPGTSASAGRAGGKP